MTNRQLPPMQSLELTVPIEADDVKGGHVNNARYFHYIGEAITAWYRGMGMGATAERIGSARVVHMANDFLHPMAYPGSVICRLTVVKQGRTSLEQTVELRDADRPEVICGRGKVVHVWVDKATGKPGLWPGEVLEKCWLAGEW